MRKLRYLSVLVASVFLTFNLCGCFDGREIDETAYLIALGIDNGEGSDYTYTFQFSAPLAAAGSDTKNDSGIDGECDSETKNKTVNNIVISAPDFYIAKNLTNNFLSKNVDMSHLKLIVFSQSIDPDGLSRHSRLLLREREIRPHTAVAVAKKTAEEYILSVNPELEANTAKYYELMALRSNNVYSPGKKLSDFVDEINTDGGASALPLASVADKESTVSSAETPDRLWIGAESAKLSSSRSDFRGMAIFRGDILCGTMNSDAAMLYNILNQDIRSCTITLLNPYNQAEHFSFRLSVDDAATYRIDDSKTPYRIYVSQPLGIEFLGSRVPDGFDTAEQLFAFANTALEAELTQFFFDISHIKKADIMKIGECYKKRFLTQYDWENMNWSKLYETAEFNVDIYNSAVFQGARVQNNTA